MDVEFGAKGLAAGDIACYARKACIELEQAENRHGRRRRGRQPPGPLRMLSGSQVASSGQTTRITTIRIISSTIGMAVRAM